jgi:hypothetical protein
MRYRIQIEELLGATLFCVTTITSWGGNLNSRTVMYTMEQNEISGNDLPELIGWLAMKMAESQS